MIQDFPKPIDNKEIFIHVDDRKEDFNFRILTDEEGKKAAMFEEVQRRSEEAFRLANDKLKDKGTVTDLGYFRKENDPLYNPTETRKFAFSPKDQPSVTIPLNAYDISKTDKDTKDGRVSWKERELLSAEEIAENIVLKVHAYLKYSKHPNVLFSNPTTPYPSGTMFMIENILKSGHSVGIDSDNFLKIDGCFVALENGLLIKANMLQTGTFFILEINDNVISLEDAERDDPGPGMYIHLNKSFQTSEGKEAYLFSRYR